MYIGLIMMQNRHHTLLQFFGVFFCLHRLTCSNLNIIDIYSIRGIFAKKKKKKTRMQSHTKILNIVYRDTDDLPKANG